MKFLIKKHTKIYTLAVLGLLLIFICLGYWLYSGQITPGKIKVFSAVPLPMAIVNGNFVPMESFISRYNLAERLASLENKNKSVEDIKNSVYDKIIQEEEARQLAQRFGVSVSAKEINSELKLEEEQITQGGKTINETLLNYGVSEKFLKNQVILPRLLDDKLKVWFNSQKSINSKAYSQADELINKINSGQDMGTLAVNFTQDENGQFTKGDMGFVEPSSFLPEFQEQIDSMKIGEIKILPSKYGLHIFRLEEKNGNKGRLRQIFLETENFENWLNNQTKDFKIINLIRI